MILFVYCYKKSHKSLIEVSFLADFWLFQPFPVFCFIFSLSDTSFHRRNVCGSIASCLPIFVRIPKLLTFNEEPICFFRK